jgi:hypothetical protein
LTRYRFWPSLLSRFQAVRRSLNTDQLRKRKNPGVWRAFDNRLSGFHQELVLNEIERPVLGSLCVLASAKGLSSEGSHPVWTGGYWLGYRVDVMVNAKNSFGGYVGAKKYTFWFRDNQLLTYFVPNDEA